MKKRVSKKKPDSDPRISFLKKISFFSTFDDHELKQLLGLSRWLKVPSGTLIIKEGSTDRLLYILVRGDVSVFKTIKGKPLELTTLTTGATFGEMAMVAETKRTAGVMTLSETYILMVEPEILHHANVFLQLKFYKRFCGIMVQRLVDANRKLAGEPLMPRIEDGLPASSPPTKAKTTPPPKKAKKKTMRVDLSDLPPLPTEKSVARTRMQRRVHAHLDLPINPVVAAQLATFLVGDCEDTRQFSDLICLDPLLAAKVLQVANSSFYRRSTAVSSVAHALVTVGIKNIQELIAEETIRIVGDTDSFSGFYDLARSFWKHSVVVGRITELLKDVMSVNVYEDVYLAGLLHDLGMLSLDVQEPAFYPQLLRPKFADWATICEVERQYIGGDHCQAGGYLFEKLGLPKSFMDAAMFHHTPEKAKDNLLMVGLVTLADLFANQRGVCVGASVEMDVNIADSFAWILIREAHSSFVDVDVHGFIHDFNAELDRSWNNITGEIPL